MIVEAIAALALSHDPIIVEPRVPDPLNADCRVRVAKLTPVLDGIFVGNPHQDMGRVEPQVQAGIFSIYDSSDPTGWSGFAQRPSKNEALSGGKYRERFFRKGGSEVVPRQDARGVNEPYRIPEHRRGDRANILNGNHAPKTNPGLSFIGSEREEVYRVGLEGTHRHPQAGSVRSNELGLSEVVGLLGLSERSLSLVQSLKNGEDASSANHNLQSGKEAHPNRPASHSFLRINILLGAALFCGFSWLTSCALNRARYSRKVALTTFWAAAMIASAFVGCCGLAWGFGLL